eukprot:UN03626
MIINQSIITCFQLVFRPSEKFEKFQTTFQFFVTATCFCKYFLTVSSCRYEITITKWSRYILGTYIPIPYALIFLKTNSSKISKNTNPN